MYCTKHPNLAANIKCTVCSRWICYICSKVINGKSVCTDCQKKQSFYFSEDKNFTVEQSPVKKEAKININPAIINHGLGLPWHQNIIHKKIPCAYHPSREGIKKCDKCHKYVCSNCLRVDDQTDVICHVCWYKMPGSTEGLEDIQNLESIDLTVNTSKEIPEGLDEYIEKEKQEKIELNINFQPPEKDENKNENTSNEANWFTNLDLSEDKEEMEIKEYEKDNDSDISIITTILNVSEENVREEIYNISNETPDNENIYNDIVAEKEISKDIFQQFEDEEITDNKIILLEEIGTEDGQHITEYISKLILEHPLKEIRGKAAELLEERMDTIALDYLLKGIKQEQDGQVRKSIARAYSKVKYKKK